MVLICFQRVLEIVLTKRKKKSGLIHYKWTFKALALFHILTGLFAILEYLIFKKQINYFVTLIGLILFSLAFVLRNVAIHKLGKYHSVHIEIRDLHELIKSGIYSYLRNPYYLSVCLEVPSLALIANSYYSFCFAICFYLPLVLFRAYAEEKVMIQKFGEEYLSYKKQVRAFLPITNKVTEIPA